MPSEGSNALQNKGHLTGGRASDGVWRFVADQKPVSIGSVAATRSSTRRTTGRLT
jgi:hypothetical protein